MVQDVSAHNGEVSIGTTGQIPTGVVTFEEVAKCFDGTIPRGRYYSAYVFLWIAIATLFLGIYIHTTENYIFESILWFCNLLCFCLFLFIRFRIFGHKIVDTPYGSISCSIFSGDLFISFPKLNHKNSKVFWDYLIYESGMPTLHNYHNTYIERIKRNPMLWLKHLFYRELENECLDQINSIPNSSKELLDKLEWYNSQKDKYYNLFTQLA